MAISSKIEWTEATWNPVRGCTKISPGCKNCYAETFAERFRGVPGHPYEQGFDLRLVPEKLIEPLTWTMPRTVFVNSMSDLFQEGISTEYVVAVTQVMMAANWHTYQVLTKRSERMRDLLSNQLGFASQAGHIWWGVSVEDREYGLPRVRHLRETSAGVRFLSIEPLLEDLGEIDLSGIHWAIVGGESGPGARPMNPAWVESIFSHCRRQDVPFFFKQWGGTQKRRTGRQLHNRTYDEVPRVFTNRNLPSRNSRMMLVEQFEVLASSFSTEEVYSSQRKGRTSAKKRSSKRRAQVRLPLRHAKTSRT